jgi:hypothetical protein
MVENKVRIRKPKLREHHFELITNANLNNDPWVRVTDQNSPAVLTILACKTACKTSTAASPCGEGAPSTARQGRASLRTTRGTVCTVASYHVLPMLRHVIVK